MLLVSLNTIHSIGQKTFHISLFIKKDIWMCIDVLSVLALAALQVWRCDFAWFCWEHFDFSCKQQNASSGPPLCQTANLIFPFKSSPTLHFDPILRISLHHHLVHFRPVSAGPLDKTTFSLISPPLTETDSLPLSWLPLKSQLERRIYVSSGRERAALQHVNPF